MVTSTKISLKRIYLIDISDWHSRFLNLKAKSRKKVQASIDRSLPSTYVLGIF